MRAFIVLSLLLCAAPVQAGSYQQLFGTMQNDQSLSARQEAEYQLAAQLAADGFLIAALYYYKIIFLSVPTHAHLQDSITALVTIAQKLKDDFVVPTIVASRYDEHFDNLSKLDGDRAMAVNYMIGAFDYRQGKYNFALESLGAVEGPLKPKARYLMGVIKVIKGDNKGAIAVWKLVPAIISADDRDPDRASLRNLALLGIARAHYALGQYPESSAAYELIPRFSKEWFDALFEAGWAYFQQEDYGRALGQVESVLSPYFIKHFRAEAYVLAATVYYSNCQFDRTRTILEAFKTRYEPALAQIQQYLATERKSEAIYADLVLSSEAVPLELLRQIRKNGRFLNYHRIIAEIEREQTNLGVADKLRGTAVAIEIDTILREQKSEFIDYTGRWVKAQWKNQLETLQQFVNQARIIKLETASSEKEIIESGGSVALVQRKRLPRPEIPSDQYNHWNFRGEYWVDEIGYYVHSVRKECAGSP